MSSLTIDEFFRYYLIPITFIVCFLIFGATYSYQALNPQNNTIRLEVAYLNESLNETPNTLNVQVSCIEMCSKQFVSDSQKLRLCYEQCEKIGGCDEND